MLPPGCACKALFFFEMSSYSHSTKNFLGFLLGAAVTAACILLLLPPAPCPCGVLPAQQESVVLGNGNGTQADPSMKKLHMVSACIIAISKDPSLPYICKCSPNNHPVLIGSRYYLAGRLTTMNS